MTALQKLAKSIESKSNNVGMRLNVTKRMTALEKIDLRVRANKLAQLPKR